MKRKAAKNDWKIIEFAYGFCVTYKSQRIALCAIEDDAEAIVRAGRSERDR